MSRVMPWRRWAASRRALLRSVGVKRPDLSGEGRHHHGDAAPWAERPQMPIIDDGRLFGFVPIGDRMRVSGSAEVAGYDTTPSPATLPGDRRQCHQRLSGFRQMLDPATANLWAGLRPVTPSGVRSWIARRSAISTSPPATAISAGPWAAARDGSSRYGRRQDAGDRRDRPDAGDALNWRINVHG